MKWVFFYFHFKLSVSNNILKSRFLPVSFIPSLSMIFARLPFFICELFHLCLCFINGLLHYTENINGIRTWKMTYGINNNIFHKLQEKNTLAFSNWTLQIKSLMKSVHAKHFQKLVRCNSYLGPLITSPPQITVFTLDVVHVNWNL